MPPIALLEVSVVRIKSWEQIFHTISLLLLGRNLLDPTIFKFDIIF